MTTPRTLVALALVPLIGVLAAGCASASPDGTGDDATASTEDPLDTRAAVGDWIRTPFGPRHRSCIHAVADDDQVDETFRVTHADGSSYQLPACEHVPASTQESPFPTTDGWAIARDWTPPTWVRKMTGYFTVPAAPHQEDALVYFFPGLEPATGSVIEQPVLAYGYGGPGWTMSSWSCGSALCVHSAFKPVAAGDRLYGSMTATSCSSTGACYWTVATKDTRTEVVTALHAPRQPPMRWVFGGVLEAYGITACDEFPESGMIAFSSLEVYDHAGNALAPAWQPLSWTAGHECAMRSSSSTHAVTISHMCKPTGEACTTSGQCCIGFCAGGYCGRHSL